MSVDSEGQLQTSSTTIIRGNDHILGMFVDVCDSRIAGTVHDPQGEGYLVEWSELFGFSQNKIELESIHISEADIRQKVEEYISKIKL